MSSPPLVTAGDTILNTNAPGTVSVPPTPPPVITGASILATHAPGAVSVPPLTSLQRAGLWLALGVGVFSIVALYVIMSVWANNVPKLPPIAIDSSKNAQVITDTAKTFETYQLASQIAAEQPLKWFDGLFTKMLYPLFALILGY